MWAEIFKRWVDLAFWWMPRGDRKPDAEKTQTGGASGARTQAASEKATPDKPGPARQEARSASESPTAATPAEPAPTPGKADEDLTVIKGIGPATQDALYALGIRTLADLANADVASLTEKLKATQPTMTEGRVRAWTKAAKEKA